MHLKLTLLLLITSNLLYSNEITDYLNNLKNTGTSDFNKEILILKNNSLNNLDNSLILFLNDSLPAVRNKSYYLIYKKGVSLSIAEQTTAVHILLNGCKDKNGGVIGKLLSYLNNFPSIVFDSNSKNKVNDLLNQKKIYHYKKLAKLAGKINTGTERLNKTFLDPNTSKKIKWISALALARQGSIKHVNFCLNLIKDTPINNNSVSYLIPDLIYTRKNLQLTIV